MTRYTHRQTEPSTLWTVRHTLGTLAPVLDVFVEFEGKTTKILPHRVEVVDNKTVNVVFTTPLAGVVGVR